jgi:hypothetical protein
MKPDVMADRRESTRYPLILIAEVTETLGNTKMMARTSDVSRTGCYLDTLKPAPKGSLIQLQLAMGDEFFRVQALVCYVSPGLGMGVRFQEPILESQMLILNRWLLDAARIL